MNRKQKTCTWTAAAIGLGVCLTVPLAAGIDGQRSTTSHDRNLAEVERLLAEVLPGHAGSGVVAPLDADGTMLIDPGVNFGGPIPLSGSNSGLIGAANNIVSLQCPNGGFGWPHGGCTSTFFNITAPITMGLLRAYEATGDVTYLNATIDGANHDLNDTWSYGGLAFSSFDPMWFYMLTEATGDPSWANIAQDDFFERLSLGTYGDAPGSCGGTDYFPGDTGNYIERHKCIRSGSTINLRPWDMQYMPYVAGQIGFAGQQDAFINDSILDGLNNLDDNEIWVEAGLAGGVHALALVNHSSFAAINSPNYPLIDGIDNLCDLADVLAGEQDVDGSWVGSTQFTAYAVLALEAAQNAGCGPYDQQIDDGRELLWSLQDKNDGAFWSSIAMTSKNIQVQGDVLMATASASDVTLNSDPCVTTGVLTVTIDKSATPGIEVFGGQFFLEYDTSVLSNPVVSGGDAPFDGLPFFVNIDTTAGTIDIGTGGGDPFNPEGTEDAVTMAVITFDAAEVCTQSDLVTFRSHVPPTRLTDGFGNEVLPTLNDLDDVTIDGTAPTFATFPSDTSVECDVSMVHLAGTHNIAFSYRMFDADTSVLFQPTDDNPVIVTGSVDISGLPGNSSGFMQLISKDRWDEWTASSYGPFVSNTNLFGFIDQAHGAANTASGGRFGIGQQITTGIVTQNYTGGNNLGGLISGFEIAFGDTEFSGTLNSQTTVRNYETKLDALAWLDDGQANPPTAGNYPLVTDWSSGAYAAIGTYTDGPGTAIFDVTFSQSNIPGPSITGEPTVDDNCDGNPTVTYSDTIIPGACPETFTIEREWTVTDFCGNSTSQTQTITIIDTTAPQLVGVPSDLTVPADAGNCDAIVSITPPTATDNCDPNPVVTYERSDDPMLTLADPFPTGTTTITWFAEDCAGNISTATTDVTVDPVNVMLVEVDLQAVVASGPFTRCIEFELTDANGNVIEVVSETLTFANGQAFGSIEVPCGSYGTCIAARGPLHTLRSTGQLGIVGTEYDAFNIADLRGGDLNDDGVIDILDFGIYVFQFGEDYGDLTSGDTDCTTPAPHADIFGDGFVHITDFNFITLNFLQVDDTCPITLMAGRPGASIRPHATPQPRRSVTVRELEEMGLGHLAIADLNNDGVVDETDIALFLGGHRP